MCLGVMMTFLLVTATISALSAIQGDLHVRPGALIWIPSAYTLVVAALVLSAGTLGNLLGRKRMFCVGVVIMIAGGVLAATAGTTGTVITAQLVAGVGGALILPNSLAALGATFADPQRRTLLAHATTTCLIFRADGRQPARTGEQAAQDTSPTA
ncbi:MFS transporter [Streptomyces sp. DSM 3412]|uniref:MFS transporter n=1 Tax=Streptomyces gottesmaniae TaxID=3075518 RepID=A0ABU2ZC34_9ACTN|nr:MFS transporter [Streptomyces sp. DSM 3412]MDT0572942.1 MFS transporter [Streptomyces sp. DSM 3412]